MSAIEALLTIVGLLQALQLVATAHLSRNVERFNTRVTNLEAWARLEHGYPLGPSH